MKKHLTIFTVFGILYVAIEVAYKAITSLQPRMMGSSSLWMLVLGGMLGVSLGMLNEKSSVVRKLPYLLQVLVGALIVTAMEFISGCVLNLWLGFDIWDYSKMPLNLLGQINIMHSTYWVIVTPTAFWLDDVIRYYVYQEERPASLARYYLRVFRL